MKLSPITLEMLEELGRLPIWNINDLAQFQKDLRESGYNSYLDTSTDFLIIEKEESK